MPSATAHTRRSLARLRQLSEQPTVLAVAATVGAAVFALIHLELAAGGSLSGFILVGPGLSDPAHLPHGVHALNSGYDGMFYFRLALDPLAWGHTVFGITLDGAYRITRIGYPALAWLAAAGHASAVPATLVVVNVLAFGVLTWCATELARRVGRHPAWGLLVVAFWGFLWTMARDLTELAAAAALLGGILAIRRNRWGVAGLCLSFAVLARETALVFVAAVAVARIFDWLRGGPRGGRRDVAWVLPLVVFAGWELAVRATIGKFPVLSSGHSNSGVPFAGIADAVRHNLHLLPSHDAGIWGVEFAVFWCTALAPILVWKSTSAPLHERIAWIGYVALSLSLSKDIWLGDVGFRSLDEVFVLAVVILLSSPVRSRVLRLPAIVVGLTWLGVFVQLARAV